MLTTEGNLQRFPPPDFHQPVVKRTGTMLALILMLAPLLLACESDKRTTDQINSSTIHSEKATNSLTNDVDDMQLCLDTMSKVDETAHSAAGRGDFERALKIWRMSSQDGNDGINSSGIQRL